MNMSHGQNPRPVDSAVVTWDLYCRATVCCITSLDHRLRNHALFTLGFRP